MCKRNSADEIAKIIKTFMFEEEIFFFVPVDVTISKTRRELPPPHRASFPKKIFLKSRGTRKKGNNAISKNLWRRKCFRRGILQNVEVREAPFNPYFVCNMADRSLCDCQMSSYTKNEYNLFYQKLDAEYFFIQQFFRKKQYFLRKP